MNEEKKTMCKKVRLLILFLIVALLGLGAYTYKVKKDLDRMIDLSGSMIIRDSF